MLIDEQTTSVGIFGTHLFQHTFALEHDAKDETGVRRRISFPDQAPEKLLRIFFRERFRGRWWSGFEFRFPKGKRLNVLVAIAPGFFAEVFTSESVTFAIKQSI